MLDYLVPQFFLQHSADSGGGMHTKVERVRRAVSSIYRLHVGSELSEMRSDFLLIEPLYFRMSQMFEEEEDRGDPEIDRPFRDQGGGLERYLEALRVHPATKILYCSEMEVFRWTGRFRKELLEICNAVTCNSDYQASLFKALGVLETYRLIDPIPADQFKPLPKRLQVVAMGRISEIKGSPFIAELFKALAPTPMQTVYVGGAGLWGEASEVDLALEAEIREYTDVFHQNILPSFVPKAIGGAAFFVGNAIHDVFSSCHAEALMSGCISIGGEHPIYAERPGFTVKTAQAAVDMIAQLTNDFLEIPDQKQGQRARQWAEQHLSFDCFKGQLTDLLRMYYG